MLFVLSVTFVLWGIMSTAALGQQVLPYCFCFGGIMQHFFPLDCILYWATQINLTELFAILFPPWRLGT